MARTQHVAVVVGLLACLLVAAHGATPVTTVRLAGSDATALREPHWVGVGGPQPVAIAGTVVVALSPGVSAPVALTFQNPNAHTVRMRRVRVSIVSITAPNADSAHPCGRSDFSVRQMPKRVLKVRRGLSDLARLRVPKEQWPYLAMVNRPVNQDGCKGARIALGYRAHQVLPQVRP